MADKKKKIAAQWLETDAAFGVSDVPVPRRKKRPGKGAAGVGQAASSHSAHSAKPTSRASAPPTQRFEPQSAPAPAPMSARPAAARPGPRAEAPGERVPARAARPAGADVPPPPAGDIADLPAVTRAQKEKALAALQAEATADLSQYIDEVATKVVFGEGDPDAPVMFVGEGPGAEEDRTGRPFVGKAGQMLDKWIAAMGFERGQVYIANVVKLRAASPNEEWGGRLKDRPPTPEEVARNIGYLHRQIEIVRPKAIVTLGAPALKYITGSKEGITKVRGTWQTYRGVPVMPTFHPAYVLRNYSDETRRKVWDDLQLVMAKLGVKRKK